jgi:membrane-associated phospholipid phosphatase
VKRNIILLLLFFMSGTVLGQSDSSLVKADKNQDSKKFLSLKRQIIPLSLISGGLIIQALSIKEEIQDAMPNTSTTIENYLQYAPIFIMYGSDLAKVKHKNPVFNQTTNLLISEISTAILTHALKKITNVTRPNGGPESFPSGHTSQSFTCATVLYNEFEDYNKLVAYSGYLFSTTTAVLRVTNDKHWVPDVLVGAGLAMIVTNVVYYFHPLKNWDPLHLSNKVSLIPDIDPLSKNYMMGICFSPH